MELFLASSPGIRVKEGQKPAERQFQVIKIGGVRENGDDIDRCGDEHTDENDAGSGKRRDTEYHFLCLGKRIEADS